MNLLQKFEAKHAEELIAGKKYPDFSAGDTVIVYTKIVEGTSKRIQAYEGLCISIRNKGINSSFVVRKISHGEGVERVFPFYSPNIEKIELVKKGRVRRAKLYYMRNLKGKAARIKEKVDYRKKEESVA